MFFNKIEMNLKTLAKNWETLKYKSLEKHA